MQLRELFKPSPVSDQHVNSWEWRYRNDDFAQALFKVGDVVYMFNASNDDEGGDTGDWSIEFQTMKKVKGISGFGDTGTGNEVEVFNTVIDIMQTLLADMGSRIQRLNFSAATSRRKSLYARMAQRLLPNWQLDQYGDHFTLTRPQPQEKPKAVDEDFSPLSGSGGIAHAEKIAVPQELKGLAQLWNKFSEENPNIKLALSLTPVVGTGINAVDFSTAVNQGDVGGAALAALGFIPGAKVLTKLEQFKLTSHQLARLNAYMRAHKLGKFINQAGSVYDWSTNVT
jgi:hypothetical protein